MATSTDSKPSATYSPFSSTAPTYNFTFDNYLKREYQFGLAANRPLCKAFLQGHCPLGSNCPDKHHNPPGFNSLVCKHWMRALCKKGDGCEFLHEYNLRRMPECNNFSKYGSCPNGDDCMYQHLDPETRLPRCPHYERGFCPLGPLCSRRHVRQEKLCQHYVAGFCPNGAGCGEGAHARFPPDLKKPVVKGKDAELNAAQEAAAAQTQAAFGGMTIDDDGGPGMAVPMQDEEGGQDQHQQRGYPTGQPRGRGGWINRGGKRGRGRGRGRGG